jgi:hypothetical protein
MTDYEGRNRQTVNLLKTIHFDSPEWTPCSVGLLPATWMKHRETLEDLVLAHPKVFPGVKKGATDFDKVWSPLYELGRRVDCWGVTWENIERGMDSLDVGHPLEDWDAFETWKPPDPMKHGQFGPAPDWEAVGRGFEEAKARGDLAAAWPLPHGFMYMLLYYLRGFENLMIDLATDDPRLHRLIAVIQDYNTTLIGRCLDLGAEYLMLGEDLGMQKSLPMSPAMWRKFLKPCFEAMYGPCRDAGIPVYMHSDGHILEIIPDLIEVGVSVLNPQICANGLAGLQDVARGKVALNQDLDRQMFPFATPSEIADHVGEVFEGLYLKEGGLMLIAECGPDVPLENIDAICSAFEKLCNLPDA